MPGKARVHELAREFGVDARTVLAKLKEQGEFVKSASSYVEAGVARRLRESFTSGPRPPAAQVQPTARAEDPLDQAAQMFGVSRPTLRATRSDRPRREPPSKPVSPWRLALYSPEDEREWTSRGVRHPDQARLLKEWELVPRRLDIVVDGQTAARWLQSGEGPGQVVARLRARGLWQEA
jgi:hypothetical protein